MTGIKPSKEHFRILDGIRGVAILLVMLFHVEGLLPSSRYFFVLHKMAWFGWTGVDLFFVLSGFLITGILLDTKHAANYFGSFYARRVLRIFPLYYGALTAIVILSHFSYTVQSQLPPHIACDFLYVSNWTDPFTPITKLGLTGHFWTLAVEEQFYLLWPFCVWMAEPKRLRMACIYGVLIACGLRCAMVIGSINQDLIYKALFTRMDTLLVGALVAIAIREGSTLSTLRPYLGRAAGILAVVTFGVPAATHHVIYSHVSAYFQTIGYSLTAATYGVWILWAYSRCDSPHLLPQILRSRLLTQIGRYSYGMYVYHIPIVGALLYLFDYRHKLSIAVLLFPVTFLVALASYRLYESRLLELKERFEPRYETVYFNSIE